MANETSIIGDKTTPSSSSADSYIGSFISVTSKWEFRYEGFLHYLNPQDSIFGLINVRSYGTEGRKTDGSQIPPSDIVYEYMEFQGSDIKDLHVKMAPPAQIEEPIHYDPAIIQSNYYVGPSSLSKSVAADSGSSTDFNSYSGPSALNSRFYQSVLPSHHSGTQLGLCGSQLYDMPTQRHGYSGAPGNVPGAQQHSLSVTATLYPMHNQASTPMTVMNLANNVSPMHSLAAYLNATPTLTSEQLSTPFTDSPSSKLFLPFQCSTLINSDGLLPAQSPSSKLFLPFQCSTLINSDGLLPAQSLPYSTSSVSDPINPFSRQQPPLLTPFQLSEPKISRHTPAKNLYPDQKDVIIKSSMSLNFSSSAATAEVPPPLLPLPPSTQKLQYSTQFTEEFDFQAMNEKFKKDELWGYLGKANQRDRIEGTQESGTSNQDLGDDNLDLESNDDFFDSISCNSTGRGARNGQNRFSERMKLDSETFGDFQQRTQLCRDGYGVGRGKNRGSHNWGRGHNNGSRFRGGYTQR